MTSRADAQDNPGFSPASPIKSTAIFALAIALITALGAILRLRHAEIRLLWTDEMHSYEVAIKSGSLMNCIRFWWKTYLASDPPLYYVFVNLLNFGTKDPSHIHMRLVSLIF